jgi:hypothetical protein
MCGTACFISIDFCSGDEKTKNLLRCPLGMKNFSFDICEKHPNSAEIKTFIPTMTEKQLEKIERLKSTFRNCIKCRHYEDNSFCFSKCRGFSEYHELTEEEKLKRINSSYRGNA